MTGFQLFGLNDHRYRFISSLFLIPCAIHREAVTRHSMFVQSFPLKWKRLSCLTKRKHKAPFALMPSLLPFVQNLYWPY